MTLTGLLILLLVGALAAILAEWAVGFSAWGYVTSVLIGWVGAWFGTWLATAAGLPLPLPILVHTFTLDLVWAFVGAVVLLALLTLVRRVAYSRV